MRRMILIQLMNLMWTAYLKKLLCFCFKDWDLLQIKMHGQDLIIGNNVQKMFLLWEADKVSVQRDQITTVKQMNLILHLQKPWTKKCLISLLPLKFQRCFCYLQIKSLGVSHFLKISIINQKILPSCFFFLMSCVLGREEDDFQMMTHGNETMILIKHSHHGIMKMILVAKMMVDAFTVIWKIQLLRSFSFIR